MSEFTAETAAALRAPFTGQMVGKLPKVTCKACSNAPSRVCADHRKAKCPACENYMTTAHIDLDYVGHAAVTDRLLQVDPTWTWEPRAVDPNGSPVYDQGGLWINLTVCGVTRPGYGDGPDPKQRISDAIRNAAMRFGVALDLWHKGGSLHDDVPSVEDPDPALVERAELGAQIGAERARLGMSQEDSHAKFEAAYGVSPTTASLDQLRFFRDHLRTLGPGESPQSPPSEPAASAVGLVDQIASDARTATSAREITMLLTKATKHKVQSATVGDAQGEAITLGALLQAQLARLTAKTNA